MGWYKFFCIVQMGEVHIVGVNHFFFSSKMKLLLKTFNNFEPSSIYSKHHFWIF